MSAASGKYFIGQNFERGRSVMIKHQPPEQPGNVQSEVKKQQYQTPTLELHHFLSLTGVGLSIGSSLEPSSIDLVVQNPFALQELQ